MNREFAKGLAKAKENDFIAAIEHFTAAISEEKNVEYFAERAVAYLNSNQYQLSLFDMNVCVELDGNNSYRYSCRAFLKARMGDADGAIVDYEQAIRLDPEDAIAYNNLGLAQEQKGYLDKAKKNFDKSNELVGYDPSKRAAERQAADVYPAKGKEARADAEAVDAGKTDKSRTKGRIVKDVFTRKSSFFDFLRFIRNGFKIKP